MDKTFRLISLFMFFHVASLLSGQVIEDIPTELIGSNILVVTPDNLLSSLGGKWDVLPEAYNPNTHLGGYYREMWNVCEKTKEDGKSVYDWSDLEKKLRWCAERHTRVTMRLAQFLGYPYDEGILFQADDYTTNQLVDDDFLKSQGLNVNHKGQITRNDTLIKIGYPQKYFWEMVREGNYPMIAIQHEDDKYYEAFPNYNSEAFYKGWYNLQKNLAKWLEGKLRKEDGTVYLMNGKPIKRKFLIEVMQAGFVGMYGEGWIKTSGVFPDDLEKAYRYAEIYPNLFPDIPLSYPLAVSYDLQRYTLEGLKRLWSIRNKYGISGLYYDVIGQENFHYYFNNSSVAGLLRQLEFDKRRIGGEGSGTYRSEDLRDLGNHAYNAHFSGVALHNFAITGERNTPLAQKNWFQFKKLVGAQLYLSGNSIEKIKGNQYRFNFQLQNLGITWVFSPFWQPYVIFRDKDGKELSRKKLNFDVKKIAPNSQEKEQIGVVKDVAPFSFIIKIPKKTYTISFAIIDLYGIYENYWLHNTGRTMYGEYVLGRLSEL